MASCTGAVAAAGRQSGRMPVPALSSRRGRPLSGLPAAAQVGGIGERRRISTASFTSLGDMAPVRRQLLPTTRRSSGSACTAKVGCAGLRDCQWVPYPLACILLWPQANWAAFPKCRVQALVINLQLPAAAGRRAAEGPPAGGAGCAGAQGGGGRLAAAAVAAAGGSAGGRASGRAGKVSVQSLPC